MGLGWDLACSKVGVSLVARGEDGIGYTRYPFREGRERVVSLLVA